VASIVSAIAFSAASLMLFPVHQQHVGVAAARSPAAERREAVQVCALQQDAGEVGELADKGQV